VIPAEHAGSVGITPTRPSGTADERIARRIKEILAGWPPMTDKQRAQAVAILAYPARPRTRDLPVGFRAGQSHRSTTSGRRRPDVP
jgi:hypothetical protein